jgi:MFS superfamily sulfate permease-like transporter
MQRHPENEPAPGLLAFRPEGSLIYVNADTVLEAVRRKLRTAGPNATRLVVCDLSASPYLDLAGAQMLDDLHHELSKEGIELRIVGAHGTVRDLLRAVGIGEKVGGLDKAATVEGELRRPGAQPITPPQLAGHEPDGSARPASSS